MSGVYNCSNRTLKVDNSVINGSNNNIKGDNNVVNGSNNNIKGDNNVVNGSNNNIKGDNNVAKGRNNNVKGDNNIGGDTGSSRGNSIVVGNDVVIDDVFVNAVDTIDLGNMRFNNYSGSNIQGLVIGNGTNEMWVNGRRITPTASAPAPAPVGPKKIELVLNGTDAETEEEGRQCLICLTNAKCVMVDCCNSVPYCIACTKQTCQTGGGSPKEIGDVSCPLCRKHFSSAKRFFL